MEDYAAAEQLQKIHDFVSRFFQGNPDLSILTHAIIRKQYLDHAGQENLSRQEKQWLKHLVEEELVQMKVDPPPSNVKIKIEPQDSFTSEDHQIPVYISHRLANEIKKEQEQKRQKVEIKLEVLSDEKDSGTDSKKTPCHRSPQLPRMFSDSFDQGDSGAGNHNAEPESNEETTKSKRAKSLQEARGQGRESTKGPGIRVSEKSGVVESEETTRGPGQSDLEEEVKEHKKATKGDGLKQRDFKKKVDKGSKATDCRSLMNKRREERSPSEGETDLSAAEEISEKKREWSQSRENTSVSTNKAQHRMGPGTQKGSKWNESGNASGSGPGQSFCLQKKMAGSQCKRKGRVMEDSGSSSEDSAGQSPVRKEGAKRARGERGSQQTGNHSKPKRQPKEREGRKKLHREDLTRENLKEVKKMKQRIQETTSEESESESGEHKSTEAEKKYAQDLTSSEGELQSETNHGQSKKAVPISHPSESESGESEDGDPRRTLGKESKHASGPGSGQGKEKSKKRSPQKSQRTSISEESSVADSEDLGSEFKGKKKVQNQQQGRTQKLQRRSATKEKQVKESDQEEDSSSKEDKPSTSQNHHLEKDKTHNSRKKENSSIQRLKRYIRECGVRRNYKKLLAGCHSCKAQIVVLKKELGSLGVKGPPSIAKCKAIKEKLEEEAELASLDINNIIPTEGRPKRRKVWSLYNKPQETPSSPEVARVRRRTTDWSKLRGVISSDGESS